MRSMRSLLLTAALVATAPGSAQISHPPLSSHDIDDLATILKLEDTRTFDGASLERLLASKHPEVRHRAVIAVGRIGTEAGKALLARLRANPQGYSTEDIAFASGLTKDTASVNWLGTQMAPGRAAAARALGEIRTAEARAELSSYLNNAGVPSQYDPQIGEALLSLGRFTDKGDLGPIVRFMKSSNVGIRWRVAWALFRPRDPAAIPNLIKLADDPSPEVRFWAVRGLAPTLVDQASLDRKTISALLQKRVHDKDRRVRTEALRALLQFDDDAAFGELLTGLESTDTWISTSAAENVMRFQSRSAELTPAVVAASAPGKPLWLRQTLLTPLVTLSPSAAVEVATSMAHEDVSGSRTAAVQALGRLGEPGRTRYEQLVADASIKMPLSALPTPRPTPTPGAAAGGGGVAAAGRGGAAAAGRGGGGGQTRPPITPKTDADYRRIVEKWIVPEYNGRPKPHAIWTTNRGTIELELYGADAPLGMEYFAHAMESGDIVGTEFSRVVPNFVDQQAGIRNAPTLRDEVNWRGLTRGNLAWASSGLDTGRPGYTLGITPQPHNEGDFTSLGRVIKGMDVVDHIEWGDKILSARIK